MNHLGLRFHNVAYGVYFFPTFLAREQNSNLIGTTLMLWNTLYRTQETHGVESMDCSIPFSSADSKSKFHGVRWITEDHENLLFRNKPNIPIFVQRNLIFNFEQFLKKENTIPELHKGAQILQKGSCDLNVGVNFIHAKSPKERDFSCGSFSAEKTALMVYRTGVTEFFYVPENNRAQPVPIPPNTLVLFTTRAFQANEKFKLPMFREKLSPELITERYVVSQLIFSFRF